MLTIRDLGTSVRIISDLSLASFFLIRATPETLIGEIYIGPVPLDLFVIMLGLFFEVIHVAMMRGELLLTKSFVVLISIFAFCLINGVQNENMLKFVAIDSICFTCLIYGVLWSRSRSLLRITNTFFYRFLLPVVFVSTLGLVGTRLGFISPARESTRLYTYSDFDAIFMLSAMTPIAVLCFRHLSDRRDKREMLLFIPIIVAGALSISTASRSGLVCSMVAFVALSTLLFHGAIRLGFIWFVAVSAISFAFVNSDWVHDTQLINRLSSTSVTEESRYTEVQLMLEDLSGSELLGKGLGSRFATNIDAADRLAFAPHIGLLALLHKAGFPIFILLIAVPALISTAVAFGSIFSLNWKSGARHVQACFAWSVVVCLVQMSLSSGWNPLHLCLASIAFSCMITASSRVNVPKPRVAVQPQLQSSSLPRRCNRRLRVVSDASRSNV